MVFSKAKPVGLLLFGLLLVQGRKSIRGRHTTQRQLQNFKNGGGRDDAKGGEVSEVDSGTLENERAVFYDSCRRAMLTDEIKSDGLLSQAEFTENYISFCETITTVKIDGYQCPTSQNFLHLPDELQLIFSSGICLPTDGIDLQMACLQNLETMLMMGDIGYIVTDANQAQATNSVARMCAQLTPVVHEGVAGFVTETTTSSTAETTTEDTTTDSTTTAATTPSNTASSTSTSTSTTTSSKATPATTTYEILTSYTLPTSTTTSSTVQTTTVATTSSTTTSVRDTTSTENDDDTGGHVDVQSKSGSEGKNNNINAAIIAGAALGAAMCLSCCLLLILNRRRDDTDEGGKAEEEDDASTDSDDLYFPPGLEAVMDTGNTILLPGTNHPVSQKNAIQKLIESVDRADWNEAFTVASALAAIEDQISISSQERQEMTLKKNARGSVSREDRYRVETISELVVLGDWTGVAVTSALYAGESTSSPEEKDLENASIDEFLDEDVPVAVSGDIISPPGQAERATNQNDKEKLLGAMSLTMLASKSGSLFESESFANGTTSSKTLSTLKNQMEHAVDSGDWARVETLSSEIENNEDFLKQRPRVQKVVINSTDSVPSLRRSLTSAIHAGDWTLVHLYSSQIRQHDSTSSNDLNCRAIVPVVNPISPYAMRQPSEDSSDSEKSIKMQAVDKLVADENWRAVSVVSGLYSIESTSRRHEGLSDSGATGILSPPMPIQVSNDQAFPSKENEEEERCII